MRLVHSLTNGRRSEELLGHALGEAWRLHLEQARRDDHGAVDGDAARVVADEDRAPARGHVLDAAGLDREVMAVRSREGGHRQAQVRLRHAVRIDAERVERQLETIDALPHLTADSQRHRRASVASGSSAETKLLLLADPEETTKLRAHLAEARALDVFALQAANEAVRHVVRDAVPLAGLACARRARTRPARRGWLAGSALRAASKACIDAAITTHLSTSACSSSSSCVASRSS